MLRRRFVVIAVLLLTLSTILVSRTSAQTPSESNAWRQVVESLPPGARVVVTLTGGQRIDGFVLAHTDDGITFKPRTRIPVPASPIAFADVQSLERKKDGMNAGKKVLVGVGAAAGGTLVVMLMVAVALAGS